MSAGRAAISASLMWAGLMAMPYAARGEAAPADGWPSRVVASYKVTFNGFDVGVFSFTSQVTQRSYTLTSDAQLSVLLGALKWRGTARSSGEIAAGEPRPAGYAFDYRSTAKQGAVKLSFSDSRVRHIHVLPTADPHPHVVPLAEHHLEEVLDPLSAVMALTRASADPCARKLAVFDGKQRFDLEFSFRRQQAIAERRPSGQPAIAYVCQVRYVPIAGYRLRGESEQMSVTDGIEVALRPLPAAQLMIPYRVTVPTRAGTAVLAVTRIEITTNGKEEIALGH